MNQQVKVLEIEHTLERERNRLHELRKVRRALLSLLPLLFSPVREQSRSPVQLHYHLDASEQEQDA